MKSKQERVNSLLIAGSFFSCLFLIGATHYFSIPYAVSAICGFLIGALFIRIYYASPENLRETTNPAQRAVLMLTYFLLMFFVGPRLREIVKTSLLMSQVILGFTSGAFVILVFGSAFMIHRSIRKN